MGRAPARAVKLPAAPGLPIMPGMRPAGGRRERPVAIRVAINHRTEYRYDRLVSLKNVPDLTNIVYEPGKGLTIGAMALANVIGRHDAVKSRYLGLLDAVASLAAYQIRNLATIGGNLVNAVPSADGAIPLIVLDAQAKIYSPKGLRSIDLIHFFLGPGQTVLEKGEILTELVVPALLPRTGSAYIKFGRRKAMELPLLGVGVLLSLEGESNKCIIAATGKR